MTDVSGTVRIDAGSGRFGYRDPEHATGKALTVWYRCPPGVVPDTPIVFALHGSDRAAEYFRDCWAPHADKDGYLVVVPAFDAQGFPGGEGYNYGNVLAADDAGSSVNPRRLWSYPILDRIFETIRASFGSRRTRFSLFGHSAGGQFVHRYVALTGAPSVDLAIAANCGWYMAPDLTLPYPAGLGGLAAREESQIDYVQQPLVLLLGDADTDEQDPGLRRDAPAMAQGPHRFARGHHYYAQGKALAARHGVDFNWRVVVAPGVGHDDRDIAAPAAEIIAQHLAAQT